MTTQENIQQPTFFQLFQNALKNHSLNIHTATPGIVQKYDAKKQMADIQPCLKKSVKNGDVFEVQSLPVITDVPVIFPRTRLSFIHFPLMVGDSVLLLFTERSLEQWRATGGVVDPKDTRTHDYSDAVCLPGFFPDFDAAQIKNSEAITLQNGLGKVEIFPDGRTTFGNGTVELIDELIKLCDALTSALTNTAIGPQPLVAPQIPLIKLALTTLKGG